MVYHVLMTVALCLQENWNYVTEYMPGGDLRSLYKRNRTLSEETVQFYTAQLTSAVGFLHKHGIIQR